MNRLIHISLAMNKDHILVNIYYIFFPFRNTILSGEKCNLNAALISVSPAANNVKSLKVFIGCEQNMRDHLKGYSGFGV